MERNFYLDLAASGLRMPIGTHLVLHRQPDPGRIVLDPERLGAVVIEAARLYRTPLALPLMDLTLEKEALLLARGVAAHEVDTFHFAAPPAGPAAFAPTPRMRAVCGAIAAVARDRALIPVGMCIGPFSLMTKLISDPITPVYTAGTGATAEDDPEVALVERLLELACETVRASMALQIEAGARAVIVCEPAANAVYFSPRQLAASYETFDRYVMRPQRALRDQLEARGVDLIFHNCGELQDGMLRRFATLDPAILSLGGSRQLWRDAALVPASTVLYGNLPTRQFYSDELMDVDRVRALATDLVARMRATGHPFILGSECDVLSVPGREAAIAAKVAAFMEC